MDQLAPLTPEACAARWCWSTSGPTRASTACAPCPTFAPGPRSTRTRAGGGRRAHAGVRLREAAANVRKRHEGPGHRLSGGGGQQLRHLARLRQPVLAGAVLHRRAGAHPPSPVRREPVRQVGAGHPATAGRGRAAGGWPASRWCAEGQGTQAAADALPALSGETYLGYERANSFASPGGIASDRRTHLPGARVAAHQPVGAGGEWTVGSERAVLARAERAHRLPLSCARPAPGARAVGRRQAGALSGDWIDGKPPLADHGTDTDAQGNGTIDAQRLYQLVRQQSNGKTGCSKSSFSTPARRPTCSPSADDHGRSAAPRPVRAARASTP
jgi:hypothetical protein